MLPLKGFYQLGYVTSDIQAGMALYAERFGVLSFLHYDNSDRPGVVHPSQVSMAWVGDTMVELIQPKDADSPLYANAMPASGFGIQLHHVAVLIEDQAEWDGMLAAAEQARAPVVSRFRVPMGIEIAFVDARPLIGHHIEYVFPEPEIRATMWNGVPRF